MKQANKIILITVLGALLIGIYIYKAWPTAKPAPISSLPPAPAAVKTIINQAGTKPTLTVSSQAAGDQVTVDKVTMPNHGFVAIYAQTAGQPDKLLGASNLIIFPETTDMAINAATQPGHTYVAELRGDNGDGLFDPKTDPPLILDGKTITAVFKTK